MNICVDVGNSTIGIGIYKDNSLLERMTFNTDDRIHHQLIDRQY